MRFFKSFKITEDENVPEQGYNSSKLRYVINKDGVGRWIRPIKPLPPMSIDFEEDVIY